jgi:hypothetical protein
VRASPIRNTRLGDTRDALARTLTNLRVIPVPERGESGEPFEPISELCQESFQLAGFTKALARATSRYHEALGLAWRANVW